MSDDELRDKLAKELFGRCPSLGRTVCVGIVDALMPVIREALAAAWDDGWGIGYRSDGYDSGTNPWRQGQP